MVTVFIGNYNRIETLDRSVRSYERLKTPHELIIVDNGSTHPRCREFLDQLVKDKRVKRVYSLPGCVSMEEATDNFNVAIRDQFESGSGGEWFAISEADVSFDGTNPEALDVYISLAKALGNENAVGPHLRVDESIPTHYPLRSRVLACETWMLYREDMDSLDEVSYSKCQIDTTFHLFPRRRFFNRLKMDPIRVGPPYDAMHLDWYLDISHPNEENGIYIADVRPVGSWGKSWIRDFWFWSQIDSEMAFQLLKREPRSDVDLCNNSFMLSWCYQYGRGCEVDYDISQRFLERSIPEHYDRYWSKRKDWMAMIYKNDFSSLGWDK